MCASIPHTTAWSRPPRSNPSARAAENTVFSTRPSPSRPTSGATGPRPFGYCAVAITGTPRMRAPSHQPAAGGRDRVEGLVGAEALLDVHHHHGGPLALEQAHAAPTTENVRRR